ncbi:lactate/malate dehydrogenase [Lactarius quietus]|nr:lactate/malate dehydrogenase [Lactarius quietus]
MEDFYLTSHRLDVVRASTVIAEIIGDHPKSPEIIVLVVGGHFHVTIVPLFSQSSHSLPASLASDKAETLTISIQFGGDEFVKAKDSAGSATFSMAYAGAEFAVKVSMLSQARRGSSLPAMSTSMQTRKAALH